MMRAEFSGDSTWSRERWFLTVTILIAVQVVVVIWLTGRDEIPVQSDSQKLRTLYLTPEASAELTPLLALMDPTMYALANRDGFSGQVWLNVKPVEHRSVGWTDPPQFLKFKQEQLLADLESFGRADPPQRTIAPAKLAVHFSQREKLSDRLKPSPRTMIEITGDLGIGDLQTVPTLPSVEFNGILAPSTLRLLVDQRGRVYSANLTESSGDAIADQRARNIARVLHFGDAKGFSSTTSNRDFDNLRRARLTVHWWTLPVPVKKTNTPPAKPPTVDPVQ